MLRTEVVDETDGEGVDSRVKEVGDDSAK